MKIKLAYAITIFTSAFLLFQVQPIIGKIVLPVFGGTAATWIVCMLFFQAVLLFGYFYSHTVTRHLSRSTQGKLHVALLAASALSLPFAFRSDMPFGASAGPEAQILLLLFASVGIPYFTLSTTGPLLQAWFTGEQTGAVPYRLFALSNLGSMIALLSYPVLAEPFAPTRMQTLLWSLLFLVFAVCCAFVALRKPKIASEEKTTWQEAHVTAPAGTDYAIWILLSASASLVLLTVTSRLTQDVAPIPLLWILPLALYLLSFILCFESSRWYRRWLFVPLFLAGLGFLHYVHHLDAGVFTIKRQIAGYLTSVFAIFMVCHGELARLRPHPKYLTGFYLMTSVGGVLGGLFVGLIAPRVFNANYEYSIALVLALVAAFIGLARDREFFVHRIPWRLGWVAIVAAILFAGSYALDEGFKIVQGSRLAVRNFYGALRVTDNRTDLQRTLMHGSIVHGEQFIVPWLRKIPTTYYGKDTGAEKAIFASRLFEPQRVGVVGLGTGTVATYGRAGDYYKFYEINPLVPEIAKTEFNFLKDSRAIVDISVGDARLTLAREFPQEFDALLLDAFSGDAIPVHLLTKEAFEIYFKHLKETGILAVHISNQYLDLAPVVQRLAQELGKYSYVIDSDENKELGVYRATWVLVMGVPLAGEPTRGPASVQNEAPLEAALWTDDYSSVYSVMK